MTTWRDPADFEEISSGGTGSRDLRDVLDAMDARDEARSRAATDALLTRLREKAESSRTNKAAATRTNKAAAAVRERISWLWS